MKQWGCGTFASSPQPLTFRKCRTIWQTSRADYLPVMTSGLSAQVLSGSFSSCRGLSTSSCLQQKSPDSVIAFYSWAGHSPGSLADAFLLPWTEKLLYIFAPSPTPTQRIVKNQAGLCLSHIHSSSVASATLVFHSDALRQSSVDTTTRATPDYSHLLPPTTFSPLPDAWVLHSWLIRRWFVYRRFRICFKIVEDLLLHVFPW